MFFSICKVKDPSSPVEFYINGDLVIPDDRVEVKDLGEGKRQLIINKALMGDNGTVTAKTPSNRGNEVRRGQTWTMDSFLYKWRPSMWNLKFWFCVARLATTIDQDIFLQPESFPGYFAKNRVTVALMIEINTSCWVLPGNLPNKNWRNVKFEILNWPIDPRASW